MPCTSSETALLYTLIEEILNLHMIQICFLIHLLVMIRTKKRKRGHVAPSYSMIDRIPTQVKHLHRVIGATDTDCIVNLRMDRNTFGKLCMLLRDRGGLTDGKYVSVEEQVAMFLGILAHHKKNRIVRFDYWRSGQTISNYVHVVLKSILGLHGILMAKPKPITDDETDSHWKWFKGCLGALDGTYIDVMVPSIDKPRYRTRKGQITTNTLAVCDRNLKFVYILPGWEGLAADSKVLRDAINRENGLKVPKGNYYLCDNGYANSDGFLAPYRGVRYHLKEWGPTASRPQSPEEMFNMRHTRARNVIERDFGIMKMRWRIFRSSTYYPVKLQIRLIMACFLIHNFIRNEMAVDPIEIEVDRTENEEEEEHEVDFVDTIEASSEWSAKRNQIASTMWAGARGNF